jgi:hypothetical protein
MHLRPIQWHCSVEGNDLLLGRSEIDLRERKREEERGRERKREERG